MTLKDAKRIVRDLQNDGEEDGILIERTLLRAGCDLKTARRALSGR